MLPMPTNRPHYADSCKLWLFQYSAMPPQRWHDTLTILPSIMNPILFLLLAPNPPSKLLILEGTLSHRLMVRTRESATTIPAAPSLLARHALATSIAGHALSTRPNLDSDYLDGSWPPLQYSTPHFALPCLGQSGHRHTRTVQLIFPPRLLFPNVVETRTSFARFRILLHCPTHLRDISMCGSKCKSAFISRRLA